MSNALASTMKLFKVRFFKLTHLEKRSTDSRLSSLKLILVRCKVVKAGKAQGVVGVGQGVKIGLVRVKCLRFRELKTQGGNTCSFLGKVMIVSYWTL